MKAVSIKGIPAALVSLWPSVVQYSTMASSASAAMRSSRRGAKLAPAAGSQIDQNGVKLSVDLGS
jgi:hypothetical protein